MNVAFIPVRGGSKSIPLKNIRPMCGRPLVYWTVKAACDCRQIDKVYIATDSEKIKETVESFGIEKAEVIGRSAESASDTASTESAMLEFAKDRDFDNIVLIQATSPMLLGSDLEKGFALFAEDDTDSVLSVVRQKRFHWTTDEKGCAIPANYDVFHRPRRQNFDGYLVENGAFYITSRKALLESENRVSGRIKAVEMNEDTFFEIDELSDWVIIEALMKKNGFVTETDSQETKMQQESVPDKKKREREALRKRAAGIKIFLTDSDGCLTDGGMYYTEKGDEIKKFNAKDGMGFRLLREKGIVIGIVTGEDVEMVRQRAAKLKMQEIHCGISHKLEVVQEICRRRQCTLEEVAYVGDDINDTEVLRAVGMGFSIADAIDSVKEAADYVTERKGGDGAIREVIDLFFADRRDNF